MVPVGLRLKNFLSYGTEADALDFEAFRVACLSGGNGQGKSALLDAVTWALWGEARKSSGQQKPDEELLRVGAREMEVELTFEVESTRYRVVRSYYRTASGKTSKPGLEFQLYDAEADAYRPLTAENVRATQAEIERRVGLDYETFINSSFLLQGRSDEFTRKRPGERKDILGRILGLDRYDRLAAAAAERHNSARAETERLQAELERLGGALEDEDVWKAEHADTEAVVADLTRRRDEARAAEQALAARLARAEEAARQAAAHRDALARLEARERERTAEEAQRRTRMDEARTLVERAEAIEENHRRYEALYADRARLDEQAELARGLEQQRQQLTLQRQQRHMELETQSRALETNVASARQRDGELAARLAERPAAEANARRAAAAAAELARLQAAYQERERRRTRVEALEKLLASERGVLVGRETALTEQLRAADEADATLAAGPERLAELDARLEAFAAIERERDEVRERGLQTKARLDAEAADQERLRREIAALDARRAQIRTTDEDACPTCGTPLTEAHRETVDRTYAAEQHDLRRELDVREAARAEGEAERDQLRRRFAELTAQLAPAEPARAERAQLVHRIAEAESRRAARERLAAELARVSDALARETYKPEIRAELTALHEALDAAPFDEARYETVRHDAAQLPRWKGTLAELDTVAEQRATLQARLTRDEAELATLRADLASGAHLAALDRSLAALADQLQAVGYDGAQHERVRRELAALADAPAALHRLLDARRVLVEDGERLQALAAQADADAAERDGHAVALVGLEEALAGRAALEAERAAAADALRAVEAEVAEAQARLGALAERLARAARDREAQRGARAALREAQRQQALYRHLRTAFGKNGIPSLIIEETLPEIEARANDLLDRLSQGRTRVVLETLKDKKTGGTKETLDIRITDEGGASRSYETYSGGEAFRVNFALRIALSQLLAERSGVRIRTLVIDEGFGTQDKEGVQSLVEAIHAIQDDFDKILVITHLDELKDAFPVRIEVTKRPVVGSTFEILGV